jgi:hypothetical protein
MSTIVPEGDTQAAPAPSRRRGAAPVVTLLLLSPVVTNLLFGSIPVRNAFAVLPSAGAWGLGALLIRELARRRGLGWPAILILGVALAVAEECVFLQTSLLPLIGIAPDRVYGRAFGVNWPYLLWALGYESVWAVALPILIVEWMYPDRREGPWMGERGFVIAAVIFVLAGLLRWYGWTQVFVPQNFPAWAHRPAPLTIVTALAAIVTLVAAALSLPKDSADARTGTTGPPRPWLVGFAALVTGLLWSGLLFLAYGAAPAVPAWIPLVAGALLAGAVAFVAGRSTRRPGWGELHSLALVLGALLASMSAGFLVLKGAGAAPVDFVGKAMLNGIAVLGLVRLGLRFSRESSTAEHEEPSTWSGRH